MGWTRQCGECHLVWAIQQRDNNTYQTPGSTADQQTTNEGANRRSVENNLSLTHLLDHLIAT
jgi:hypothetical protein